MSRKPDYVSLAVALACLAGLFFVMTLSAFVGK